MMRLMKRVEVFVFGALCAHVLSGCVSTKETKNDEVVAESKADTVAAPAPKADTPEAIYLDVNGKPLDVYNTDETLKSADGPDDFDLFKAEALKRKGQGVPEEQKAEEELIQLREAEARVEAEKARQDAEKLRLDRERHRREAGARARKAEELRRDVRGDVDNLDGVGEQDVSWKGLE